MIRVARGRHERPPVLLARWCCRLLMLLAAAAGTAAAQEVTQRGFVEPRLFLFPQQAPNDPTQAVVDLLAREEVFAKPVPWLELAGGVDFRANSHDQVDATVDFLDRGVRRPMLSVRRLSATITHRWLTLDVGKQFIRWGKTDIVTPTDRFAPRDFLDVVDNDFLSVTGVRATADLGGNSLDAAWVPLFTPSRIPLLDQRWTAVPAAAASIPIVDVAADLPHGSQAGVRWNHPGERVEYSVSFFDGYNNLPDIDTAVSLQPLAIDVQRVYPAIRSYGGDLAVPSRWFTLKAESAYVTTSTPGSDEYVLYVVQLERQAGEWLVVGGYAGEAVTEQRTRLTFAPDRGLTKSFLGRASYTIDANRSVAFESAVKQDGRGVYVKGEYSQARGDHWRLTATAAVIAGHGDDFLGQYRRNSHVLFVARYSY